jgi:hypothetical protein
MAKERTRKFSEETRTAALPVNATNEFIDAAKDKIIPRTAEDLNPAALDEQGRYDPRKSDAQNLSPPVTIDLLFRRDDFFTSSFLDYRCAAVEFLAFVE